jgi:hypothetical protein
MTTDWFELGTMPDGTIVLAMGRPFPHPLKRVEYYRDQKLFKLIYDDGSDDGELIEYEVSDQAATLIKQSARNIYVISAENRNTPDGYDVPLVQVGV